MEDGKIFLASYSSCQMKKQEDGGQAHLPRGWGEGGFDLGSFQEGKPTRHPSSQKQQPGRQDVAGPQKDAGQRQSPLCA